MMVLLVIVIIMTIDMTTIAEDDVLNARDCVFASPRDTQCPERVDKPADNPADEPADRRADIPNSNVGAKPTEIPLAKPTW
ncbi:hypothetical protein CHUAL_012143 [Chamberlinius hualienensis]